MATCTSVKVVWGAVREAGTCTYLVRAEVVETSANDGSGSENGGSGGAPAAPSVTTATQLEMSGLRAASAYIVRVAANCSDGRRSPWTDVAVSTEPPTLAPDAPNAPLTLQGGQDCRIVSLRLPASPAGCRQPDEYALQYLPDPAGQWLDHHQHLRAGSDVNVSGLRPGGTYEFRLSATNWIGVSRPGRSTGPIRSCAGTPSLARPEAAKKTCTGCTGLYVCTGLYWLYCACTGSLQYVLPAAPHALAVLPCTLADWGARVHTCLATFGLDCT